MTKDCGVYIIKNTVDKKVYIGSSKLISGRFETHKKALRRGIHINSHLQNAWNKYGEKAFTFEVLEYCEPEVRFEVEQGFIEVFGSLDMKKGYNMMPAVPGHSYTEEIRQKISEANRRRKLSEESKRRIANSLKGNAISEENKKLLRESVLNKPLSDEHKKKISEATRGQKRSSKNMKGAKRLSAQEKAEIEILLKTREDLTLVEIGRMYGVGASAIGRIKRNVKNA